MISLCGQHQLDSIIVSMTRLRHHQAKQHPQYEDLILHAGRGRVGFIRDPSLMCIDQGRKSLPSSYFIDFSLPNIYVQIRPGVMLAWSSAPTSRHDQVASAARSLA
jgi:hypothetical protein